MSKGFIAAVAGGVILILGIFVAWPNYRVWQREMSGKALLRVNEWRPVKTAPVRTWILTISKNGADFWTIPQTMRLTGHGGEWESLHGVRVIVYHQPTHWMPLPEPPKEGEG